MLATATALTARGRATRDRIVAAAASLIYERGVAGTSLDDVRAVTATSKSQLYHYFADKSALVRAVIELQVEQVLKAQQPELDSADSVAGLRRWGDRVISLNGQDARGCPLGRLASELADSDPAARAALTAGFARWQGRLAAGLEAMREHGALDPDADPQALALGLLAAVQGGAAARAGRPFGYSASDGPGPGPGLRRGADSFACCDRRPCERGCLKPGRSPRLDSRTSEA